MSKITEYTLATRFDADDVLLKDGTNGTKNDKGFRCCQRVCRTGF